MKHPHLKASHAAAVKTALTAFSLVTVVGWGGMHAADALRPVSAAPTAARTPRPASTDRFVASEMERLDGTTSVIVRLSSRDGRLNERHRAELATLGATIVHELPIINSVALRLPRRSLTRLASASWAAHLSLDSKVKKTDEFTSIASGAAAAYQQFGASNLTGRGVTVAIVDSGIKRLRDLKEIKPDGSTGDDRITLSVDFIEGKGEPKLDEHKDESGHGTHIAGVIAGSGYKSSDPDKFSRTFRGVAPGASLVSVRVLDEDGTGAVSDVIAGLQTVIQHKSARNIRVVNLSLGHPVGESYTTDPLCQAVEQVWKSGIVVVCAAGNNGRLQATKATALDNGGYGTDYGSVSSPGNSPYVITVGAMRRSEMGIGPYTATMRASDQIASYSSRGPSRGDLILKPDLVAPGDRIISLGAGSGRLFDKAPANYISEGHYIIGKEIGSGRSKDYYVLSGTSIAAPVVAGAAALMIQRDPTLTPDTVKARLMLTADKWAGVDGQPDPFTFGAGYLNVQRALNSTVKAEGYALSPFVSLDAGGTLRIGQHASVWPGNTFWGTGITNLQSVWGSAVYSNAVMNDQRSLAGRVHAVGGDAVLWGGGSSRYTYTSSLIDSRSVNGDQ